MADVSKDKLRKEITAILKNADLKLMSAKKVRQQLEEKLDVDLTDQKQVVDDLVMELLTEKKSAGKKGKRTDSEDEDKDGEEENGGAGEEEDEDDEEDEKEKRKATKRGAPKKSKASDSEELSDDDDEEEYGPKKKARTPAKKAGSKKKKKGSDNDSDEDWGKNKKKGGGSKRGGGGGGGGGGKGGYTRPINLSPELAKLVGKDAMPRHEVVKKIWAIIKEKNLYDPENKQFAICDNDLMKVFGVKRFRTFGMMKYLKHHFIS